MKRKGFTLIELLVVIAIIAILAAILFPVFAKARAKARQSTCLSNVKQMTLGILMYKADYDETFPPTLSGVGYADTVLGDSGTGGCYDENGNAISSANTWVWQQLINPYISGSNKKNIAICPDSPDPANTWGLAWYQFGGNDLIMGFSSPSQQTWDGCKPVDADGNSTLLGQRMFAPKKETEIVSPQDKYLIMDYGCYFADYADSASRSVPGYKTTGVDHYLPGMGIYSENKTEWEKVAVGTSDASLVRNDVMTGRHNGGNNVGFCDGHVQFLSASKIMSQGKNASSAMRQALADGTGGGPSSWYFAAPGN